MKKYKETYSTQPPKCKISSPHKGCCSKSQNRSRLDTTNQSFHLKSKSPLRVNRSSSKKRPSSNMKTRSFLTSKAHSRMQSVVTSPKNQQESIYRSNNSPLRLKSTIETNQMNSTLRSSNVRSPNARQEALERSYMTDYSQQARTGNPKDDEGE